MDQIKRASQWMLYIGATLALFGFIAAVLVSA